MRAAAGAGRPFPRLWRGLLIAALMLGLPAGLPAGVFGELAGSARAQGRMPVTLTADRVFLQTRSTLVAEGAVEVWHGSVRLTAQRVVYDRNRDTIELVGPITLSDGPDRIVLADAAQLSTDLREGLMESARFVLNEQVQIAAGRLERREGRLTEMDRVIASTCQVCAARPTPLWEIRAARVTHDQDTRLLHFHRVQLRFGDVPVLYTPYLRVPDPSLTRARGLLTPQFRFSTTYGASVAVPYFIPFGDRRDLTLTPVIATSGAVSLGMRWRQAFRRGGIEFGGQVSGDDVLPGARWFAYGLGQFDLGRGWDLAFDITAYSDNRYLGDYDISDASRIMSHITAQRLTRDEAARLRMLYFDSLRVGDVAVEQPNRAAQAEWDRVFGLSHTVLGGTLRLRAAAHAHQRVSTVDVVGRDMARISAQAEWRRDWLLAGGVVLGAGALGQVDHYRVNEDSGFPDPVTRSAWQGMVELRWPWAAQDARGTRYVIEPVAQVIAAGGNRPTLPNDDHRMPELDQGNLFAFARYTGLDAPDLGSRANLGLRWLRDSDSGLSAELAAGRIWRLTDAGDFDAAQPLGGQNSNWLLGARLGWGQSLQFTARALFDDGFDIAQGESTLDWTRGAFSLAGTYFYAPARAFENRPDDTSTINLGSRYAFDGNWEGRAQLGVDLLSGALQQASAGLTYRNECLLFDLSLSRNYMNTTNVPSTPRLGLRLELLGFGGTQRPGTARACPT
jgi:LPS-assembly protein